MATATDFTLGVLPTSIKLGHMGQKLDQVATLQIVVNNSETAKATGVLFSK